MYFEYNQTELDTIASKYFESLDPPKLILFPSKEKKKYLCLLHIKDVFEKDVIYHERDINEVLKQVYPDYVTIRRYLVDYGFLMRTNDGSEYRKVSHEDN